MRDYIILGGPTGSGKTALGILLAKRIDGEIISADSMQIYRGMDIGTAKVTKEESQGIKHHLIDIVEPWEAYSLSQYVEAAKCEIRDILNRGKVPIVLGGTGLYIHGLMYKLNQLGVEPHPEFRREMEVLADANGKEAVYKKLLALEPETKVDPMNLPRVIRALELATFGAPKKQGMDERDTEFNPHLFVLTLPRKELYRRINFRVDRMLKAGLVEEVKGLMEKGYDESLASMKAIGYKEVIQYLKGTWDYSTMEEKLKQHSRNYAKRQLTWFRRYEEVEWLDQSILTIEEILTRMEERLKE